MSKNTLNMKDYMSVSEEIQTQMLKTFAQNINNPPNGELGDIKSEIRAFEHKYSITSNKLIEELKSGNIEETFDICEWLILIDKQERHNQI